MIDDFCKFFQKIEEDPKRKIHGLTVRDYYMAADHIKNCDNCYLITLRVAAKAEKQDSIRYNMN